MRLVKLGSWPCHTKAYNNAKVPTIVKSSFLGCRNPVLILAITFTLPCIEVEILLVFRYLTWRVYSHSNRLLPVLDASRVIIGLGDLREIPSKGIKVKVQCQRV